MYATPQQFIQEFGQQEVADLLQDDEPLITESILQKYLADELVGGLEECEAIERAIKRLDSMISQSSNYMDGYIAKGCMGKSYSLPFTPAQINQTSLATCNLELARCQLMEDADNGTEQQEKRCNKWHSWLRDISRGSVELIPRAETVASNTHKRYFGNSKSNYNWNEYP